MPNFLSAKKSNRTHRELLAQVCQPLIHPIIQPDYTESLLTSTAVVPAIGQAHLPLLTQDGLPLVAGF